MTVENPTGPNPDKKEKILKLIATLQDRKNNWVSEIPAEVVTSGNFKVRKNWFQGVETALFMLARHYGLSKEIYDKFRELVKEIRPLALVSSEDISRADALIDQAIQEMNSKVGI